MSSIPTEEWNQFIDQNLLSDTRVLLIAYKIQHQQALSPEEISMYQSHASRIELQLLQIIARLRSSES